MWGRLDAAGWLVYTLIDPRRLRLVAQRQPVGSRVTRLLGELAGFGAVPLQASPAMGDGVPTRADVEFELAFLDDDTALPPPSLPLTSLWLATAWQRHITADELPNLAGVITGQPGEQTDNSPPRPGPGQGRYSNPAPTSTHC